MFSIDSYYYCVDCYYHTRVSSGGCSSGPIHRWEQENTDSLGGVISLDNYDITADGLLDLLVGRDDGTVEIYSFDESDEPIRRFKQVTYLMYSSR